ncbi:MAG: preprotein translocase subunit SecY [Candidatus Bathyarchaeota archaeon]|uniref:preprotein translocase subunit SecY n=1 Tax=Candidatus Bathycorpusculum sp. TaxID=2994959 RepID=UPI00282FD044|nr:preprotein translocase subunit SecY [Candidatus Termiticorpusculum sp.]MCL2291816.1 preprotein translocase subunit SecY [Candidatus Termiticorpusculum sp.]
MAGRFLSIFKPIGRILPEIKKPTRKVSFNEKIFWTALVLIIFLVMTEIPLYGVDAGLQDQFGQLRVIFASNKGTLMELGIGPIVTAGLILQLLVGSSMIKCDMSNPEDRSLFTSASKVFSIGLTAVQAGAYIISGMYGTLTLPITLIILLQLIATGIIVMLLDELLQKGWGLGSGISLFIMAGVAQNILWSMFSPQTGLFIGGLSGLLNGSTTAFEWIVGTANGLPSLIGFIATIAVFIIIIYMQGIRVELPITYAGYKGFRSRYPIKLLYVSNLPVIFAGALFANVFFFTQLLWTRFGPGSSVTKWFFIIFGNYGHSDTGSIQSIGGIAHYVSPPHGIIGVANATPIYQPWVYLGILVVFCAIFSLTWLEIGGLGPNKVAQQLMDSGMQIPGYRRSEKPIEQILRRYIPAVTVLGGVIVGLIAGFADFLGVFGSGTGILLSVGIIYQYYELLMRERAAEMFPAFKSILGE